MPKKAPSTRAYEHATFNLGMVSLPLSVYTGTVSDHGIKRNQFRTVPVLEPAVSNTTGEPLLDRQGEPILLQKTVEVENEDGTKVRVPVTEDHPVGYGSLDKVTGDLIQTTEVTKKIATEYGHVFVEDHEIEKLFEIQPKTINVRSIQQQTLFFQGQYVPKALYYVEVTKTKVGSKKVDNKAAQNNFAVIMAALRSMNAMAIVDFTTRGVPKPAVLMPNGTLWVIYHTDELREQRPNPDIEVPSEVAKAAFEQYLRPLYDEAPLDLTDERTALIQAFADEKAAAGDFGQSVAPEEIEAPVETGGMDLLSALTASLNSAQAAS